MKKGNEIQRALRMTAQNRVCYGIGLFFGLSMGAVAVLIIISLI